MSAAVGYAGRPVQRTSRRCGSISHGGASLCTAQRLLETKLSIDKLRALISYNSHNEV